jgi:S1-C subfamily serine protease
MLKRALTLALMALLACAKTYKKDLPPVAPAQGTSASAPEVYKFSDKAHETRLAAIVFDLPVGYRYGEAAGGYYGGCRDKQPLVNTKGRFSFDTEKYVDLFNAIMKKHGYPVEDLTELFQDSKERVADLKIGARIVEATLNECYPDPRNNLKATGSAYLKIEWSVYSMLEKKVVLTTVTEGSTYSDVESSIGEAGLIRPAFADALERLARNSKYREVVDPPKKGEMARATGARIRIQRVREFSGDLKSNIESIKKAVATVTANRGSGSGFVISEDGTVVTAEHVVSGSKLVKVNVASGKECYGEVAAASKQRDLAIIRLDCTGFTPLPLSRQMVVEGSEVYAIGTPLSEKLQFSVTKGVVSGIRKIDELDYIQSDVTVLPGSSGGPLLDSRGNVVGVTLGGISRGSAPIGVNFFIPLTDLDRYVPVDFE